MAAPLDLAGSGLVTLAPAAGPGLAVRACLVVALLVAASAVWWVARRRAARFRSLPSGLAGAAGLTSADLGHELGARATFVQFSAATCSTCPQVSRALTELAAGEPGVVHVNLASEDHMDLVRRFSVYRTPTVLVVDAVGTVRSRTSGPLTPARAVAALRHVTHGPPKIADSPRSIDV
ncbi:thioredoxin family protein [Pengzhenrongella sp.]|uniref:TlpA family protein disulfide reductase n=1 Tax=Pengzhenrongella sp. TaxID=2888820 RepID=UPI002F92D012